MIVFKMYLVSFQIWRHFGYPYSFSGGGNPGGDQESASWGLTSVVPRDVLRWTSEIFRILTFLLRGSGYLGYVDSNQGYNPYKWVICPLTRVIDLHITGPGPLLLF